MTLVYKRPFSADESNPGADELSSNTPVMHALILGIGRFSKLDPARDANRQACADSARAMISFLIQQDLANTLEVPLASVECLISDPSTTAGSADQLAQTHPVRDPRFDTNVESAVIANVNQSISDWLTRCRAENTTVPREGDHLVLYICSHGVAGRDEGALAVLEDVDPGGLNPWSELLNVGSMARHIPAKCGAGAVWIFMDACQEVLDEIADQVDGNNAMKPVKANVRQLTACKVTSLALIGSTFGDFAYAPRGGGVAYFTEALMQGLSQSCVEFLRDEWRSTAKQIPGGVIAIAKCVNGRILHTEAIKFPTGDSCFMKVANPHIPIGVVSSPTGLLLNATTTTIQSQGQIVQSRPVVDSGEVWHTQLPIGFDNLDLVIQSVSPRSPFMASFRALPPAQWVEIKDE